LKRYGGLQTALGAGRFSAIADRLRLFRFLATMNRKAPLSRLRSQKPTWHKAAALAREPELNQLAHRLEELHAHGSAPRQPALQPVRRWVITIVLSHTIVPAHDKKASARFSAPRMVHVTLGWSAKGL